MLEKLKLKIDENKKDNSTYKKYIEAFYNTPKAKELFARDDDFKEIQKELDKKEDEF
jgi:hypothetical protein